MQGNKTKTERMNEKKINELLEFHQVKPTANRVIIARALLAEERPMSLSELEYKILTIDKSGIFRTLNTFKTHHLVHVLEDGGDGVRYELCLSHHDDCDDDMHVHFYCESCHKTFCMVDTPIPMVDLPEGYHISTINYMIKGICPECERKSRR